MKKAIIYFVIISIIILTIIISISTYNKTKYNGVWETKNGYLSLEIYNNHAIYSIGEDFDDYKVKIKNKSIILTNENKEITCNLISKNKIYCKTIGTLQKVK